MWVAPVIAFALVTPVSTAQSPAQASADRQPTTPSFAFGPDEPAPALKQGKVLRASRVAVPPVIDGSLHDEAWTLAETASDYVQRDPDNGAAMTEVTRIQVVYDDRYIYVAIHCGDSSPAAIAGGLSRRDQLPSADHVTVAFDPRHDHLTAYVFQTNPSAVQADLSLSDDDREDRDYNAVWEVRTHVGGDGWTAEFRIPFSQMRFEVSELPGQVWGFQAERHILRKAERGTWVPKPRGRRGEVSLFGHLVFDTPLPAPDRVELLPYTLARAAHDTTAEAGRRSELGAAVGADVRLALGSAATLAVTVNPDFGHVEQDPAVLNLSVFETFYPEKRSFFLEDSRIFVPRAGLFQLFHSRRIGRVPGHFEVVDDHHVVRRQDHTTIVGAAKVTGKSGRWTYGALTAATGREYESVERQDGSPYSHLGEPLTSYNVVRVQRDMRSGSSNIGALATGVIRERSANAFTAGADYNLRWDENRGAVNGHWVVTRAPGDNGVRTSGGGVANFNFTRKHWNTWAHVDRFGRDFRVADLGFLRVRADRTDVDGGIHVEQPDPGKILRSYGGNLCGGRAWNREVVFDRWLCVNGFVSFLNFWRLTGGVTRRFDTLDDLDTRGGPAIVKPAATAYYFNVDSDARKSWQLNMSGDGKRGTQGDFEQALAVSLQLQASPPLQLSLSARHVRAIDIAQWIENREATREGVTDHIYGTLRRNVLDLALRGTYSIHRDLTLQTYVQPFVAVGDYEDIRRLARPRSYEFEAAAINADPDFNSKSVRSNVVLRWEYLRGSTLFLVWGLSQTDMSRPGRFSAMRDLRDTFRGPASHVLMAKMTYWLNR